MSRTAKTILTCAITGAVTDPNSTPYLPISTAEIADSALAAADSGAAVVHIHVRNPDDGSASMKLEYYVDVVNRIKKLNTEVLINLTTGPGAVFVPGINRLHIGEEESILLPAEQRTEHITEIKPDLCSLDFNVMHNAGNHVRINFRPVIKEMLKIIKGAGVKPELECFDSGDVRMALDLQKLGLIEKRPLWQFVMGIKYGWEYTPASLSYARTLLPQDALWAAFGISAEEMPMVANTWLLGGHVRVGLEDNIYLRKGILAKSNAELVLKGRRIIEDLGGTLASPADARNILAI